MPTGPQCEDGWTYAAAIAPFTERLRFLGSALRPGILTPALAARQAAALDRISNGRLLLNVVTGGNPTDLAMDGVFLPHDQRYAQTNEFLTIWRGLFSGKVVDFDGRHLSTQGGRLTFNSVQRPYPPIWFGGSSDAGMEVAADHADVYLTWAEPPAAIAEKLAVARAKAATRGRKLRFGLRVHLIVRETEAEAWTAAEQLISRLSDDTIARAQQRMLGREMDSRGATSARSPCTRVGATGWRSVRTCGPGSGWCAMAPAWPWSAARSPSRPGCANTGRSVSKLL